ncbi:response regulator transcription factor [Streptomyces sp. NPDC127197]|uniref:response regulator transcription factor n=1 Tax=Streptomyces sp. NPDC127197 TaxID=3345388 RepID=UPI0036279D3A
MVTDLFGVSGRAMLAALIAGALRSKRRDLAAAVVEFAESRARRNPRLALFQAAAAQARGLLDGDRGRLMDAAGLYGEARPLLRAGALRDAGELTTSAARARTCFEQALELYDRCGAQEESGRLRSRLRRLGIRPVTGGCAAEAGWRGLTPAELGVVRLIAHGATNREAAERLFLSPHTVNTHLRHAFSKLGVRSRVQLARFYLREVDQSA